MAISCGVAPRSDTSPRAIIWAMIDAGKAVLRIMAERPVVSSSLSVDPPEDVEILRFDTLPTGRVSASEVDILHLFTNSRDELL
jgi:hypothetical protein